jgi:hypothetical protein
VKTFSPPETHRQPLTTSIYNDYTGGLPRFVL